VVSPDGIEPSTL